jgi:hypothetical protein
LKKFKRRQFISGLTLGGLGVGIANSRSLGSVVSPFSFKELRIGIVGLSVHSAAFSQLLNDDEKESDLRGCRVSTLFHPQGNPDVDFSKVQLEKFAKDIVDAGVKIVRSMHEMLELVDVVMIETNDGRPHLEQVLPVFKSGKPVFIDKPIAADLKGVVEIFEKARHFQVPVFSSSALRYLKSAQQVVKEEVMGAFTYSPAPLEKSHTDLFWYGIHGVELLYSLMGPGCREVMTVHHTEAEDLVIGFWNDGRVGTFKGIRQGKRDYGGIVFGRNMNSPLGTFEGYRPLVVKIVEFFLTGKPPVPVDETLEIYTFMEAAQQSQRSGGTRVNLSEILQQ